MHKIAELEHPEEQTINETSCHANICDNENNHGMRFVLGVPDKINLGTYTMKSKEDRKQVLVKRSKEHFKKEVKEVQHEMRKKAVQNFKDGK